MNSKELVLCLWYFTAQNTGLIYALAGKGYVLSGSDEEKLATLRILSKTDFHTAKWRAVPERYKLTLTNSSTGENIEHTGVINTASLDTIGMPLYEEILKEIEDELASNSFDELNGSQLKTVPNEPLRCMTAIIKDETGVVKAVV